MKLFGLGLSRTGSSSLAGAMQGLGFKSLHFPKGFDDIDAYDFTNDSPISSRFELLDERYPGSKFIYCTRDVEAWIKSCLAWFPRPSRVAEVKAQTKPEEYEWLDYGDIDLYGRTMLDMANITREELVASYPKYDERVKSYFKGRPDDLLTLDLTNPSSQPLTQLVSFLERQGLVAFPKMNTGSGDFHYAGETSDQVRFCTLPVKS